MHQQLHNNTRLNQKHQRPLFDRILPCFESEPDVEHGPDCSLPELGHLVEVGDVHLGVLNRQNNAHVENVQKNNSHQADFKAVFPSLPQGRPVFVEPCVLTVLRVEGLDDLKVVELENQGCSQASHGHAVEVGIVHETTNALNLEGSDVAVLFGHNGSVKFNVFLLDLGKHFAARVPNADENLDPGAHECCGKRTKKHIRQIFVVLIILNCCQGENGGGQPNKNDAVDPVTIER